MYFSSNLILKSLVPMVEFFNRWTAFDATQALVGVVVFLLALEVQLCSSSNTVTAVAGGAPEVEGIDDAGGGELLGGSRTMTDSRRRREDQRVPTQASCRRGGGNGQGERGKGARRRATGSSSSTGRRISISLVRGHRKRNV